MVCVSCNGCSGRGEGLIVKSSPGRRPITFRYRPDTGLTRPNTRFGTRLNTECLYQPHYQYMYKPHTGGDIWSMHDKYEYDILCILKLNDMIIFSH